MQRPLPTHRPAPKYDLPVVAKIARRAFAHMVAMIHVANNRDDADRTNLPPPPSRQS